MALNCPSAYIELSLMNADVKISLYWQGRPSLPAKMFCSEASVFRRFHAILYMH